MADVCRDCIVVHGAKDTQIMLCGRGVEHGGSFTVIAQPPRGES